MTVTSLFDQLIDQYKLEKHIGQHPFTDVYLAYDVDQKHSAHVEILQPEYADDSAFSQAFLTRATALSRVTHPNLVRIYQAGMAPSNRPYMATESLEGYPLSERLAQLARQKAPVHSVYALKLIRQIAEAVQFAERLDIRHEALTPENVLLKSVTLRTSDSVVLTGLTYPPLPGTFNNAEARPYLSPEQLAGKEISERSSVYSLGAILYHLLAGAPPAKPIGFWESTVLAPIRARTRLQDVREDLSAELYTLVARALRSTPSARYRSVPDFISAVDAAIEAEELRIRSEDTTTERRRPLPVFLLPLLLLLACSAILFLAWQGLLAPSGGGDLTSSVAMTAQQETAIAAMVGDLTPTPTNAAATATPAAPTSAPNAEEGDDGFAVVPTAIENENPTATPTLTVVPSETPTVTPTAVPLFQISVPSASLRVGPGTIYPAQSYVYDGDIVEIVARNEGDSVWYNVRTAEGLLGWVSATVGNRLNELDNGIDVAATIPVPPTRTPTPTPLPTPTFTPTPSSGSGGGNGGSGGDGGQNPPPVRPTPTPNF